MSIEHTPADIRSIHDQIVAVIDGNCEDDQYKESGAFRSILLDESTGPSTIFASNFPETSFLLPLGIRHHIVASQRFREQQVCAASLTFLRQQITRRGRVCESAVSYFIRSDNDVPNSIGRIGLLFGHASVDWSRPGERQRSNINHLIFQGLTNGSVFSEAAKQVFLLEEHHGYASVAPEEIQELSTTLGNLLD